MDAELVRPRLLSLVLALALGAVVDAYFLNGKARLAVMQTLSSPLASFPSLQRFKVW